MHFLYFYFFFNDTATTEIYTLSLHDALPICLPRQRALRPRARGASTMRASCTRSRAGATATSRSAPPATCRDRKSTRLNSSHGYISYAVFCLKKKKKQKHELYITQSMQSSIC